MLNRWARPEAIPATLTDSLTTMRPERGTIQEAPPALTIIKPQDNRRVRLLKWVRADAFVRSSSLLIADYLFIGAIGGFVSVVSTRAWSPHDVGAVAGVAGAVALISTASSSGIATTITRFLGSETNQRAFVLEAITVAVTLGLAMSALLCFVPFHFGVPIHNLRVSDPVAFLLVGLWIVAGAVVTVTDPAFLSRSEVSFSVAKDVTASIIRVAVVLALIGSGAVGLMVASIVYVGAASLLDIGLIFWRLKNDAERSRLFRLRMIRKRLRFAAGSHSAALVSTVPTALLGTIVAAHFGAVQAAYVTIPAILAGYITIIPTMTSHALLAELGRPSADTRILAARGLRLAYAGAIPAVVVTLVFAPLILLLYGRGYSAHSTHYLRWEAGAAVFQTFNYVGDTVLLARQKVFAYNAVNIFGAVAVLGTLVGAVELGRAWIGPAWFVGEFLYTCGSCAAILRYASLRDVLQAGRALAWRLG
jgi:O-antigen/teichoic acid export membrane protein